jgi:hypothetical protein
MAGGRDQARILTMVADDFKQHAAQEPAFADRSADAA